MTFLDLPIAAGVPLLAIPLLLLIWVVVQFIRGEWTTRKHIDQVQKMADTFQHAWETSMQADAKRDEQLAKFGALTDTFEHFIKSLPKPEEHE